MDQKDDSSDTTIATEPNLTAAQVDRLLQNLKGNDSTKPSLQGRSVLIPYGRCAFWEGELQPTNIDSKGKNESPSTVNNAGDNTTTSLPSKTQQEGVYVAVPGTNTPTDPISMPLTKAIEWLEQYSSQNQALPKSKQKNKESKSATPNDKTPNKSNAFSPATPPHSNTIDTSFPMVEIQEEYSQDGRQVYGKVVDITSRLQHLWSKQQVDNDDEEKTPHPDDVEDHVGHVPLEPTVASTLPKETITGETAVNSPNPRPTVSDEEYERLTKRLEELEMMEAQEQQRTKVGRLTPSNAAKSKKQSGLSFQKGFLNAKPKEKAKAAATSTARTSSTAHAAATAVTKKSKITIDLNKNTVQEIPQEGQQQPVPPRLQSSAPPPLPQQRQTMMDANMFSGQIQERPRNASVPRNKRPDQMAGNASNTTAPKKKVSRFAQERMQQ